jgi:predicted DNA-binding protein
MKLDTYSVFRMTTEMRHQLKTVASNSKKSTSALIREGVLKVLQDAELEQREAMMRQQFMA